MWSWRGATALVLATAVGAGWVIAALRVDDLTRTGAALFHALGATIVGGVIAWLLRRGGDDDEPGP